MLKPYARVELGRDSSGRPLVVNARTKAMLDEAQRRLKARLTIVQGSYRAGAGATASAGTHDGGGVVDIRTWDLAAQGLTAERVVRVLRKVGFAAWYRTKAQGFDPHIHAVAIGDRDLHPSAARQVEAYRAGRNGLASNGPDDGPRVPIRTWEQVSLPKVSLAKMRQAHRRDRRRVRGLYPRHTRRVQRALGVFPSGRWNRKTRRAFPGVVNRDALAALGRDRFRVTD